MFIPLNHKNSNLPRLRAYFDYILLFSRTSKSIITSVSVIVKVLNLHHARCYARDQHQLAYLVALLDYVICVSLVVELNANAARVALVNESC